MRKTTLIASVLLALNAWPALAMSDEVQPYLGTQDVLLDGLGCQASLRDWAFKSKDFPPTYKCQFTAFVGQHTSAYRPDVQVPSRRVYDDWLSKLRYVRAAKHVQVSQYSGDTERKLVQAQRAGRLTPALTANAQSLLGTNPATLREQAARAEARVLDEEPFARAALALRAGSDYKPKPVPGPTAEDVLAAERAWRAMQPTQEPSLETMRELWRALDEGKPFQGKGLSRCFSTDAGKYVPPGTAMDVIGTAMRCEQDENGTRWVEVAAE